MADPAEIHAENYRLLQEHVLASSGIVLDDAKHYLLETRLRPVVRDLGLDTINDLCHLLRRTREPEVGRRIAEAMTTNETYFFRDPKHYDVIRKVLLPRLREERKATRTLRFWSAAASTGQEAYSLAMLLLEEGLEDWKISIFGTDFSSAAVERARSGRYQQIEVNRGLPTPLLVRHFHRAGAGWQLKEEVRRMVEFQRGDLRNSMRSLGPFDLVFCRNVLIYFDTATRMRIIQEMHGTLYRGCWLLFGGAESMFGIDSWFERQTADTTTIYVAR